MTGVEVLVPWRPDGGWREQLWHACVIHWGQLIPGVHIITGDRMSDEPINRAAARNAAARDSPVFDPWQVAVFADADVMIDQGWQVHAAVEEAGRTGRLVYAHTWRAGMSRQVTDYILAGDPPGRWLGSRDEWTPNTSGSCYAVPRRLWQAVGGFDDRFRGRGFEELAFRLACTTLGGVSRVEGVVYHLWHPQPDEPHRTGDEALWRRYLDAAGNPEAMRQVLTR